MSSGAILRGQAHDLWCGKGRDDGDLICCWEIWATISSGNRLSCISMIRGMQKVSQRGATGVWKSGRLWAVRRACGEDQGCVYHIPHLDLTWKGDGLLKAGILHEWSLDKTAVRDNQC